MSARGQPLPVGLNHHRRHVARIAKRRSTARPRVGAAPAARSAISHAVIWTSAGPSRGVILIAASLNDNRGDGSGRQRGLYLALAVRTFLPVRRTELGGWRRADGCAWGRNELCRRLSRWTVSHWLS
jgi:hypothetical protein